MLSNFLSWTLVSCYDFVNPIFDSKDAEPILSEGKYEVSFSKQFAKAMEGISKEMGQKKKKQKLGKFAEVEFKMNDDKSYESIQKDLDKNEFKNFNIITKKMYGNIFAFQTQDYKNDQKVTKIFQGEKNEDGFVLYMFDFQEAGKLIKKYNFKEVKKLNGKKTEMLYDAKKEKVISFLMEHEKLKKQPMMVYKKI